MCIDTSNLLNNYRGYTFNTINEIFIMNCFFTRINSFIGDGGIISITNNKNFLNLIEINFYICSCTNYGGAIYFHCYYDESKVNFNKICSSYCLSNFYQFCYILTYLNMKSYNNYSFISYCKCNNLTLGDTVIMLHVGYSNLRNINSSNNKVLYSSGITFSSPVGIDSKFTSYLNNYCQNYYCIYFALDFNNNWTYSNIINNNSPTNYGVITVWYSGGIYLMNNCIFLNNLNILFYLTSGSELKIINCTIIHDNLKINSGTIFTLNINFLNFETFNLNHYCNIKDYTKQNSILYQFNFLIIFLN